MGIVESMGCAKCKRQLEDLKHIFCDCNKVRILSHNMVNWFNRMFNTELHFNPRSGDSNINYSLAVSSHLQEMYLDL